MAVRADKVFTPAMPYWLAPMKNLFKIDNPVEKLRGLISNTAVPLVAFLLFLVVWGASAAQIETSLGKVPGPAQV